MSTNLVDKDTGELITLANGTRMWIGTRTAHDLAVQQGTIGNNILVCITDDYKNTMIGEMKIWCGASNAVPDGWLYCDGSAVSRTQYADLFAVIGTSFGSGDGSTTFNIPDMRESVPKGAGETGKTVGAHVKSGGLAVGEFLDDRVQEHTHIFYCDWENGTTDAIPLQGNNKSSTGHRFDTAVGNMLNARTGDTTEVKSVGVNYIICYE